MRPIHLVIMLALAAPLAAQRPDSAPKGMHHMMGPMGMGPGPHDGSAMRLMAFTPEHILMHKDDLKLTDAQVAKLTTLRDGAKTAHDAAMAEMGKHAKELAALMSGANPDTTQLKPHFQAMQAAMGKGHWAMIASAAQARAVLTDVQRARADGWGDMMEGMGGRGMMMRGPGGDSR